MIKLTRQELVEGIYLDSIGECMTGKFIKIDIKDKELENEWNKCVDQIDKIYSMVESDLDKIDNGEELEDYSDDQCQEIKIDVSDWKMDKYFDLEEFWLSCIGHEIYTNKEYTSIRNTYSEYDGCSIPCKLIKIINHDVWVKLI